MNESTFSFVCPVCIYSAIKKEQFDPKANVIAETGTWRAPTAHVTKKFVCVVRPSHHGPQIASNLPGLIPRSWLLSFNYISLLYTVNAMTNLIYRRHHPIRRKRGSNRCSHVLPLLPALFLLICFLLYRLITIESTAEVSPERLQSDSLSNLVTLGNKSNINHMTNNNSNNNKPKERPTTTTTRVKQQRKQRKQQQQQQKQQQRHHHIIPNILTFTHSINLLEATNVTDEDVALQANVQNTIRLHSDAEVHFLTDLECRLSIERVMGSDSPLIGFFDNETKGMYKADICRGVALYETGGLYLDVDLQARMSMWDAIFDTNTTFVVPLVHAQSKYPGAFFQAFIGVTPHHAIMLRYVQLFLEYYQGHLNEYVQRGQPLGVLLLRKAYDDVVAAETSTLQHVQFWQEVLYSRHLFPNVPPPNWGTRRACHFVVVANGKPPFVVPLYSRVNGSRMCGGKESQKQTLRRG